MLSSSFIIAFDLLLFRLEMVQTLLLPSELNYNVLPIFQLVPFMTNKELTVVLPLLMPFVQHGQ